MMNNMAYINGGLVSGTELANILYILYFLKVEAAQHWSLKQMREHIFTTLAEANLTERRPNSDSKNSDDIPTFRDFLEYILITKYTGYT